VNLTRFVREHDRYVRSRPASPELIAYHREQIAFVQKEREVHLKVTLAFALFALLCSGFALAAESWPAWILTGLFLLLLIPYVFHYFLLENAVQGWHFLLLEMERRGPFEDETKKGGANPQGENP
jgi:hypothetical protein